MKWLKSLLAKYMLIILVALFLIQVTYIVLGLFVTIGQNVGSKHATKPYNDSSVIEKKWHNEAERFKDVSRTSINGLFEGWKKQYPNASMFWVNGKGVLAESVNVKEQLPSHWSSAYTAKFIKDHYDGDPFTVVAFLGGNGENGFIVFEIPRLDIQPPLVKVYQQYGAILVSFLILMVVIFIVVSFLFFRGIRQRILNLQNAMSIRDTDDLPVEIDVKKQDEIGQLEKAFNQMVIELKESKKREQDEEQLRRELIASLSHDLRTPLTKIRAQSYVIKKESLTEDGQEAITLIDKSIVNIDRLIDNLMSYTLLSASKYSFEPRELDVIRQVRESLASWYSVFEKEGFEIDVDLHAFKKDKWFVDPIWLGRIIDNLFQNVLRHAKNGRYIGVTTESTDQYDAIVIKDRGKGIEDESSEKGVGIGLTIVDLMIRGMQLDWGVESNNKGTVIKIKNYQ